MKIGARLPKSIKGIFSDSAWSIAGLMLMNLAAQFVVYPAWGRKMGSEAYGNVLTLISYINIFSVAIGSGCNYARMRQSKSGKSTNGEYNVAMILASVAAVPVSFLAVKISHMNMSTGEFILYILLMCGMLWRYYADVDFRLGLNFRGFFAYYLVISIGYLLGIGVYYLTGLWPAALLLGELSGLIYVFSKGAVLRKQAFSFCAGSKQIYVLILTLISTNLLLNLIFNADRLLLSQLVGGTAVSLFYVGSLLGKTVSLITTPLNSVIIGYTARYSGRLSMRMLMSVVTILLAIILIAALACTVASHILIRFLYPDLYEQARTMFFQANLSQVIYCTNNVLTTFLLCFTDSKYQLYINVVYLGAFVIIGIPSAIYGGLWGFVLGLIFVNVIRFSATVLVGLRQVLLNRKNQLEERKL